SYAQVAASGPSQTPAEVCRCTPTPEIESTESASTSSLVDVDTTSVRTVPSDFMEQDVQTDTQQARKDREEEAEEMARAEADLAKKKAAGKVRKADNFLTKFFGNLSNDASTALVVSNFAALVGLSGFLSYKAYGLYERGRLGWKHAGIGLGVLGVVGVFEGTLAQ
ncbi:uncharacterized protein BCR38DRAFT_350912, partial [Pseudomassariella vexata]